MNDIETFKIIWGITKLQSSETMRWSLQRHWITWQVVQRKQGQYLTDYNIMAKYKFLKNSRSVILSVLSKWIIRYVLSLYIFSNVENYWLLMKIFLYSQQKSIHERRHVEVSWFLIATLIQVILVMKRAWSADLTMWR